MASAVSEPLLGAPAVLVPGERKPPAGPTGRVLWGLRPNQRMQSTGRMGAGRRAGGALRWSAKRSVGLCGREHDSPQLVRKALGRHDGLECRLA